VIAVTLLVALQLGDSITEVRVRDRDRTVHVPIVFARTGPLLRASELLPPLGARLSRPARDRFLIEAGTTRIELTAGLPYARVGTVAAPLSGAPIERDGEVYVPLALVTDVLPRHVPGYTYDARAGELRRFTATVAEAAARAAPSAPRPAPRATSVARSTPRRTLVVVDAGHGGPDRGMSGPIGSRAKIHEADITLAVAKRVRDALKARGIEVLMTRTTDTLIALADRGRIANRAEATLFLSIHVNAANPRWPDPRGARGFETFFLSDAKTEDERRVEEMENDADRFTSVADAEPGDPLSFLLTDMKQNEFLRESSELAESVQGGLQRVHPGQNRGVKQAGFRVLLAAYMPAVLVEIGFGTNAAEARYLASEKGQQSLATAIADATKQYLARFERRNGAGASGR
jgi:N-acetylmuramoyl-L-alanine amidase